MTRPTKETTRTGQKKPMEVRRWVAQPTYVVVVDIALVLGQHRPGGQRSVANIAHKVAPPFVDGPHVGADVGRLGKGSRAARNCAWVSPRLFVNRPLVPKQWRGRIPVPKKPKSSSAAQQHSKSQARSKAARMDRNKTNVSNTHTEAFQPVHHGSQCLQHTQRAAAPPDR